MNLLTTKTLCHVEYTSKTGRIIVGPNVTISDLRPDEYKSLIKLGAVERIQSEESSAPAEVVGVPDTMVGRDTARSRGRRKNH